MSHLRFSSVNNRSMFITIVLLVIRQGGMCNADTDVIMTKAHAVFTTAELCEETKKRQGSKVALGKTRGHLQHSLVTQVQQIARNQISKQQPSGFDVAFPKTIWVKTTSGEVANRECGLLDTKKIGSQIISHE